MILCRPDLTQVLALYINKPLVRLTTVHYQSAVSMISFAQVLTVQWSDTIPKRNVQFQVGITSHGILFQQCDHSAREGGMRWWWWIGVA